MALPALTQIPDENLLGVTCRTPAEHRKAIAAAGVSKRPVLAWPTGERLRRSDARRFGLLCHWLALHQPGDDGAVLDPGDDTMAEPIYRAERPSLWELLGLACGRPAATMHIAPAAWSLPRPNMTSAGKSVHAGHNRRVLGELVFIGGELKQWGTRRSGLPKTPYEKLSRIGGRRTGPSARWRKALHGSADGEEHGSGAVALLDREHDGEGTADRTYAAALARAAVGPWHAEVLDLAISCATAKEVGEEYGFSGKYAERKGIRLINEALDTLGRYAAEEQPRADNDNYIHDAISVAA